MGGLWVWMGGVWMGGGVSTLGFWDEVGVGVGGEEEVAILCRRVPSLRASEHYRGGRGR